MCEAGWKTILEKFHRELVPAGLDLAAPFGVQDYNSSVGTSWRLPDFGRERTLAIVVAASRAFWRPFLDACRKDPGILSNPHPVDDWSELNIRRAAAASGLPFEPRWPHLRGPETVAIQRAAVLAGLAHLSPSHLCIHPVHGPWIALRGVVVFDMEGPANPLPPAPDPCTACPAPCLDALKTAQAGLGNHVPGTDSPLPNWPDWVEIRSVCPAGTASRYEPDQIRYHYAKDRTVLVKASGGR